VVIHTFFFLISAWGIYSPNANIHIVHGAIIALEGKSLQGTLLFCVVGVQK
jgi:hypothetical protein